MTLQASDVVSLREVVCISNPMAKPGRLAGHTARRLIPGNDFAFTDPFIVMAEDWMPRNAFPLHPHRGIETVTLVLEGAIEHSDSAGHHGIVEAGDAQWMTAGRGVTHEENSLPGTVAHTLQLWINLPSSKKMTEPRYQDLRRDLLPSWIENGVAVRLLSGSVGGIRADTLNHVPVTAVELEFAPDTHYHQLVDEDFNSFVLVLSGEVLVGRGRRQVSTGELAWLTEGAVGSQSAVSLTSKSKPARALLFAGKRLHEPVAMGGPFVMNTPAEVEQAFEDYREGRF